MQKITSDTKGTASIEAVVILPFFILIFAGILFMENQWVNKQKALLEARTCAFSYANQGCHGKPASCENLYKDSVIEISRANSCDTEQGLFEPSILDAVINIPVVGDAVQGLLGSAGQATSRRTVTRPQLYGGGNVDVRGNIYLMCNERKKEVIDLIKDVFCSITDDMAGC